MAFEQNKMKNTWCPKVLDIVKTNIYLAGKINIL